MSEPDTETREQLLGRLAGLKRARQDTADFSARNLRERELADYDRQIREVEAAPAGAGRGGMKRTSDLLPEAHQRLVKTSVALPAPLLAWMDAEAAQLGFTRNAFVCFTLQLAKQTPLAQDVRELKHRVEQLDADFTRHLESSLKP